MPTGKRSNQARLPLINVQAGSGNVFADLGLPHAEELLAKAQLVSKIGQIIHAQRLTQTQAAKLLGIDQPKVSSLLRGNVEGYSSDRLFRFLNALGHSVEIVVRKTRPGRATALVVSA